MEKYLFDITLKIRIQKKGMTPTEVNDVVGNFAFKLLVLNTDKNYL